MLDILYIALGYNKSLEYVIVVEISGCILSHLLCVFGCAARLPTMLTN